MIAMMLDDKSFKPKRLESLRQVIYGASPILESTLTKVLAELPNIEFYQGYGQTEGHPLYLFSVLTNINLIILSFFEVQAKRATALRYEL